MQKSYLQVPIEETRLLVLGLTGSGMHQNSKMSTQK